MKIYKSILILFLLVGLCGAGPQDKIPESAWYTLSKNKYKCNIKKIKDGDTFICDIVIPEFQVMLVNQDIRIWSFDAPEISHKRQSVDVTDEEIKKGLAAKAYFEVLSQEYEVYVAPEINARDPYGRFLCSVWLTDKDHKGKFLNFAELMTSKGYVR